MNPITKFKIQDLKSKLKARDLEYLSKDDYNALGTMANKMLYHVRRE